MIQVTVFLDARKSNKLGLFPVKIKVYHKGQNRFISTKIFSLKKNFKNGRIFGENCVQNQIVIDEKIYSLESFIESNKEILESYSATELITMYKQSLVQKSQIIKKEISEPNLLTLKNWGEKIIERAKASNSFSTSNWYQTAINNVVLYNKGDIFLNDLTPTFLLDFEASLYMRKLKVNSVSAVLRAIRAILNKANNEIEGANFNPFGKFKIKQQRTKKRSIPIEIFQKFRNYKIEGLDSMNRNTVKSAVAYQKTQNIFLYSFDNMGMNFFDIAQLTTSNFKNVKIKDGRIISASLEYYRSKTKKSSNPELFSIVQTAEAISILNYFKFTQKKQDEPIFPFNWKEGRKGYENYKSCLKRNNLRFKKIMKDIGFNEEVSSYWIRHSWANIARNIGVPIEEIGAGLGHKSFDTTQIYLKNFEEEKINDTNSKIVGATLVKTVQFYSS